MAKKLRERKPSGLHSTPPPEAKNGVPVGALDAVPVTTAPFVLSEDGTIQPTDDVSPVEQPKSATPSPPHLAYRNDARGVWLYHGNCLELLDAIAAKYPDGRFDSIFADPPYFLSNGGITCHAGKMVKVDKGDWD